MTQESNQASDNASMAQADRAITAAQDTLSQFLSAADVQAVYGEPLQQGDATIIPCAEVLSVAGFGVGSGFGRGEDTGEGDTHNAGGGGGGGGGGGRVLSRPVAVIVVSPEGVTVKPVVDVTKIALAGITAWGFMLATLFRMQRRKH
ncbi:MAG: hypothetical protein M1546_17055 [Chloroflexi bacterium]|nr:hypothetical protein [Chloroflexota bacterium]